MNPSKLSRERLYFNCFLKFVYGTLNQINSSIEINTIYTGGLYDGRWRPNNSHKWKSQTSNLPDNYDWYQMNCQKKVKETVL